MKPLLIILALGLCGPAFAALVKIDASYDRLELKDGRLREHAVIESYDTMTDRVMIRTEGREPETVSLIGLPDAVAAEVRERIPLRSEDGMATGRVDGTDRPRTSELNRHADADRKAGPEAAVRSEPASPAADAAPERDRSDVALAAQQLARRYFIHESEEDPERGRVYDTDVNVDPPQAVRDSRDRWQVTGKARLHYIARGTGAMGRDMKDFTMLLEFPAGGTPRLVEMAIIGQ